MSETTQQARESRAVMRSARYAAPQPITAIVSVAGARVHIAASDRTDTVVQVEPVNQASRTDMKVAARTKVDFTGGQLTVKTTTSGKKHGSVAITIDLPNGSNLVAYLAHSSVHADGSLADCELHVASDRVRLDRVGTLQANVGAGEVAVGHVAGPAKIESRSGQINIEHASADLELSNGSGAFDIERVDGNVTVMTGSG
ncbi:MAG TPA: DUF4097 family beta strand repeat-containing protein, partial [Nocardioidaceae bacterium]